MGVVVALLATALCAATNSATDVAQAAPPKVDTDFSFAVIPDTQTEVTSAADTRFVERTQWLVNQRRKLDLRFVTHVGDIVNWGWLDPAQYARAQDALSVLDRARIPYALSVGNHDTRTPDVGGGEYVDNPDCVERFGTSGCQTIPLLRHTEEFNAAFPTGRISGLAGTGEAGKIDNSFTTYAAGGVDWLVLSLEPWPRLAAVTWAQQVVAAHPRHNVIVLTHSYLNGDGSIYDFTSISAMTSPQYVYDNLIRRYPNIKVVLSGHTGAAASRVDTGDAGNTIVSLLTAYHSTTTNPVRLVTVDTAKNTLATWVYAPRTDVSTTTSTFTGLDFVHP